MRIGAGEWRSRFLRFPDVPGLRPTPDRVRETVFNWLGQDMHGLRVLDLFAGTGVMGFEALSRGAAKAVMVEKSSQAYRALQENSSLLKATQAQLLQMDAEAFLGSNRDIFDVIFLDPPYHQGWLDKLLPLIGNHLADDGYLYVEAEYQLASGAGWEIVRQGRAGAVFYHLFKKA